MANPNLTRPASEKATAYARSLMASRPGWWNKVDASVKATGNTLTFTQMTPTADDVSKLIDTLTKIPPRRLSRKSARRVYRYGH